MTPHRPVLLFRLSQLSELDGILSPTLNNQGLTWKDYCIPVEIKNVVYQFQEHSLKIIPTDTLHCEGLTSCGLKFVNEKNGKNIILSGDIKKLAESNLLAEVNDLTYAIIQDVSFKHNPVQTTYDEVLNYYPPHLHHKIYGIHFEDDINHEDTLSIHLMEQGKILTI